MATSIVGPFGPRPSDNGQGAGAPGKPASSKETPAIASFQSSMAKAGSGAPASQSDMQKLLKGDYSSSQPQDSRATAPSNVTTKQLMDADGGLLKNLGDQQLSGAGAQGINGGIDDNLAEVAGGKPGDIGKNKDVTMRALEIAETAKNIAGSNGQELSPGVRHNGNMSGLNPSGEVDDGSDMAQLQNLFKDPSGFKFPTARNANDHMNAEDTEKSGGQIFGDKLLNVVEAPFKAIGDVVTGVGKGIGDLFDGHASDALGDVGKGFDSGAHDIVDPVVNAAAPVISNIPVVGGAISSNIQAIGNGIDDVADGGAKAADDVGHGQFGQAVSDWMNGTEGAVSGVVNSVAHDPSNVVNQVGLGNTSFGQDINKASDWVGNKASGAVTQTMQTLSNPAVDIGQMGTDGVRGNWSGVGQDAENLGKDAPQAAAVAAATVGTGGLGDVALAGARTAAGAAGDAADGAAAGAASSARGVFDDVAKRAHQGYDMSQNIGNTGNSNQQQNSDA